MIEFKIISSPDKSQQATYHHLARELTLGKSEGDMIVDDPGFGALQLKVALQDEKNATIENLNPEQELRLNGRPIDGVSPLKEKDNVTVARTTINFSRLDLAPLPQPDPYEAPNFQERVTPGSKEKALLDALEYLERNAPAPAGQPPLPGSTAGKPPLPPGAPAAKPPLPPGQGAPPSPPPLPKKP